MDERTLGGIGDIAMAALILALGGKIGEIDAVIFELRHKPIPSGPEAIARDVRDALQVVRGEH